jgi:hypothetical protein
MTPVGSLSPVATVESGGKEGVSDLAGDPIRMAGGFELASRDDSNSPLGTSWPVR